MKELSGRFSIRLLLDFSFYVTWAVLIGLSFFSGFQSKVDFCKNLNKDQVRNHISKTAPMVVISGLPGWLIQTARLFLLVHA